MAGELEDVLPLDDEESLAAANPFQADGTVAIDNALVAVREAAMKKRLTEAKEPVAVIILGVAHDLSDELDGTGVDYQRILPKLLPKVDS